MGSPRSATASKAYHRGMKTLDPFARLGWFFPIALVGFGTWGCGSSNASTVGPSDSGSTVGGMDAAGGDAIGSDGGAQGEGGGDAAGGDGGDGSAPTTGWDYAKIGGGGFITGGQVAADGTKFFRTDTSGGYLYDDTTGRLSQIVPRNLPAGVNVFLNGTGVYEAMIAPSNSKRLLAAYDDALYGSTDGGNTFTLLKSGLTFDSNSNAMRTYERHGQIDPQNPSHIRPTAARPGTSRAAWPHRRPCTGTRRASAASRSTPGRP
jgi:hypothetical protein